MKDNELAVKSGLASAMLGMAALTAGAARAAAGSQWVSPKVPHPGADQIFWVPTYTQAEQMAKVTGRPIMAVAHVSDWNGY